jgi:hypothetical protein
MNKHEWNGGRVRGMFGGTSLLALAAGIATAWAQTAPVLKIKPVGTNQISITITNNIGTNDYDLKWIPFLVDANLANPNNLWGYAAIGVPGGTNFLLDAPGYESAFFMAELDTNTPPLWQAADPNNPTNGAVLQVFINNPTNGANITQ